MSEASGWPTRSRAIRLYLVPSKRSLCLHVLKRQNQDSTLAALRMGFTLLEGACGHLGFQGRCWKITSEHQVLCVGDLPPSLHGLEGDKVQGQSHEISGNRSSKARSKNTWKGGWLWASPLKGQVPWGLKSQSTPDLVVWDWLVVWLRRWLDSEAERGGTGQASPYVFAWRGHLGCYLGQHSREESPTQTSFGINFH